MNGDLFLLTTIEILKLIGILEQYSNHYQIIELSKKTLLDRLNHLVMTINNIQSNKNIHSLQIDLGQIIRDNHVDEQLDSFLNDIFTKINKTLSQGSKGDILIVLSNEIVKIIEYIERCEEYYQIICQNNPNLKYIYDSQKVLLDQITIFIQKITIS